MRQTLIKLNQQRADLVQSMDALMATANSEDRALTDDEQAQFDETVTQVATVDKRITNEQTLLNAQTAAPSIPDANVTVVDDAQTAAGVKPRPADNKIQFPSRRGTLQCFVGENGKATDESSKAAYRFGMWLKAIAGQKGPQRFCKDYGIPLQYVDTPGVDIGAAYNEGTNTAGGYLVLPEFDAAIIRLVEFYGLARQLCRVVPMGSETKDRNRRTGGLTAYFVGESDAGTESTGSWDRVSLIAKKLMVLTRMTNELNADSIINTADNIAMEVAYALAKKEDQCLFLGDGTSTYGSIMGVIEKLSTINGVDEGGGLILADGNLMSEIVLGDFNRMVAILPDYAEAMASWISHKYFYAAVMQRLEAAAGGNTIDSITAGNKQRQFLGDPVKTTNTMPKTDANSQIVALYGDMRQAVDFGDRAQMTMAVSDSATVGTDNVFEQDELAFRATERFDINVHDVGDSTNAGPVVGLISKAS